MSNELPKAWAEAELGTVLKLVNGFAFKPSQWGTRGLPIIRIQNLNNPESPFNHCDEDLPEKIRVNTGDLLFAWSGTPGTSFGAHIWGGGNAWLNQHIFRVGFDSRLFDKSFLKHAINQNLDRYIAQAHGGAGLAHITKGMFEASTLRFAPLTEQRRIVAKLEKLFTQVGACKQRLARIPLLLKRFRQSVLAAACSGRLTADWREENRNVEPATTLIEKLKLTAAGAKVRRGVPENVAAPDVIADWDLPITWGCYSAADLLRCGGLLDVKDGNHGANHPKVSEFTKTGLSFITAAQVNNFRIDYDSAYKLSGEPLKRIHVGFARTGDVIYTHKGSVGRVGIADRDCVLTPQTTYYRVNPKAFANGFVMFYLASQAFSEQVNVVKEQTTRDFVPISEQYLLFHRVPPLPEQQEIVRRVESLFALADRIEARFAEGRKRVDSITQAILAKAFRGELVPTEFELAKAEGRSFESAEELLTRIGTASEVGRNGNGAKPRKQRNKRNDLETTPRRT
jgi:type I restriction enzyme, S subunit